jgi:hypothetical protein
VKGLLWINLLAGVWLIFTAWIMPGGYASGVMTWNDLACGVLLIAFSWWGMASLTARPGIWLSMLLGVWLLIAPFAFGYAPWNDIACGICAIAIAAAARTTWNPTTA